MLARLLNIVLVFTLIIAVPGVSPCNTLCSYSKDQKAHSCCTKEQAKHDCCSVDTSTSNTALSIVNPSADVPDVLLSAVAILHHLDFSFAVLDKTHGKLSYNPPLLIPDISVLNRVFRI